LLVLCKTYLTESDLVLLQADLHQPCLLHRAQRQVLALPPLLRFLRLLMLVLLLLLFEDRLLYLRPRLGDRLPRVLELRESQALLLQGLQLPARLRELSHRLVSPVPDLPELGGQLGDPVLEVVHVGLLQGLKFYSQQLVL
jgi:hypothetical protein